MRGRQTQLIARWIMTGDGMVKALAHAAKESSLASSLLPLKYVCHARLLHTPRHRTGPTCSLMRLSTHACATPSCPLQSFFPQFVADSLARNPHPQCVCRLRLYKLPAVPPRSLLENLWSRPWDAEVPISSACLSSEYPHPLGLQLSLAPSHTRRTADPPCSHV